MDFTKRYKKLNPTQRLAVDTIDGPVMVVAGPGTGKTELLSMRVANILKKTDTQPENILCLTFTDAGSIAMQKRLTSIIGRDAYNVSIFTFHAFGSEIMNKHREFFYGGANFRLADDLARHRIITEILDSRDYNSPLRSQMNGQYTTIGDILTAISDLKRAGLTDEEFRQLLDNTQATVDIAGAKIGSIFTQRVSKATKDHIAAIIPAIEAIDEPTPIAGITPLKSVLAGSLRHAVQAAEQHDRVTPPLTAWKKEWMSTDAHKNPILKVQKNLPKLRELNAIYSLYLQIMTKAELLDYDDMIMQTIHAIEVNDELRYELQEKYHYIMVDEFQDTNMAQMRILHNLTNNPVVEGKPNILVVGDDDQAIYGFQGAEVGNIINFMDSFPNATLIPLTDNYRSSQTILNSAREVILQGEGRLEAHIEQLEKTLAAQNEPPRSTTELVAFATPHAERQWIVSSIASLLKKGVSPSAIAIIGRKHADLVKLLSYMAKANIPISYDRRDNVLDDEAVTYLLLMGTVVQALSVGDHDRANALLPELIAHPAWKIDPTVLWRVSLAAHKDHRHWLEILEVMPETQHIFRWLTAAAKQATFLPLERIVDVLIGNEMAEDITSPLKEHYFGQEEIDRDTSAYTMHLENLSAIRRRLREHSVDLNTPKLGDFLQFIDDCRASNIHITSLRHVGEDENAVQLLTAHGSKGLEFDHVFIINATDTMWGEKVRVKASDITFPPHLRLRQNNGDYDERLRLFYVAMTRARHHLHITYANENDTAKEVLLAAFLVDNSLTLVDKTTEKTTETDHTAAEHLWYAPLIDIPSMNMREYLAPVLARYKLSATHVNNFIDIVGCGPRQFLLNTLLRFPNTSSPAANYGTAIHAALQRAHNHLRATGSLQPEEDILQEFERQLDRMVFTEDERRHYLQQGCDALSVFLRERYQSFSATQLSELDFSQQNTIIGNARLTGKLDVVELDRDTKTIQVIDYKTGSALHAWDKGDTYKKIKAHKYRQQLLFYKLLVEHSRDWHSYTVTHGILRFVEPDDTNTIVDLSLTDVTNDELERFMQLTQRVWQHIQELSFPDTSQYEKTINGIIQFENDLLSGKI